MAGNKRREYGVVFVKTEKPRELTALPSFADVMGWGADFFDNPGS